MKIHEKIDISQKQRFEKLGVLFQHHILVVARMHVRIRISQIK